MEIELSNFRCWKKHNVKFNDKGLILLTGGSGSGKSSILNAIYFILTGNGNKLVTHGQTKCFVKISFDDGPIQWLYRSKGPCRLLLQLRNGLQVEDDEAQKILDSTYGKHFQYTSYMTQKMVHSFLNMSQSDKLNFLQKFVMEEENIQMMKKKCKDEISKLKKTVAECTGKLDILRNELNSTEMPQDVSSFSQQVILFNPQILEGLKLQLQQKQQEINNFKVWSSEKQLLQESQQTCKEQLEEYKQSLHNINSCLNSLQCKDDNFCDALESCLHNLQTFNSIREFEEKIEIEQQSLKGVQEEQQQFFENEKSILVSKLSSMDQEDIPPNDLCKFDEFVQLLFDFYVFQKQNCDEIQHMDIQKVEQRIEICSNSIQEFSDALVETERRLFNFLNQQKMQSQLHKCPNCKSTLKFVTVQNQQTLQEINDINHISSDELLEQIQNSMDEKIDLEKKLKLERKKINVLETDRKQYLIFHQQQTEFVNKISNINSQFLQHFELTRNELLHSINQTVVFNLKQKVQQIRQHKQEKQQLQNQLQTIETKLQSVIVGNHPLTLQKQNNINQWKNRITLLTKSLHNISQYSDELSLLDTIPKLQNTIQFYHQQQQQKQLLQKQKDEYSQNVKEFTAKLASLNCKISLKQQMLNDHQFCFEEFNQLEIKIKQQEQLAKLHHLYQHNQSIWKQRRRLDDQIRRETYILEDCNEEIVVHEMFITKIQEAESVSLSKCIDSVNYYINEYLESFFAQDPILVNIHAFKNVNNEIKSGINIKVLYKGEDIDVNSLSGGEYDRVSLAIMLAFNHICKSDMILLDESIASLDSELTNEILNSLKQNLVHKRIIVVAHQLSTGIFDQIVSTQ